MMKFIKSNFSLQINLILLFLIFQIPVNSFSQVFSKIGIKGGLIISGTSSTDEVIAPQDNTYFVNYLNFDVGCFTELFTTRKFGISAEFHYELKGHENPGYKIVLEEISNGEKIYKSKYLSDRFNYLSFQILPRYKFEISHSGENIYVLAGPVFDLLVSNSNSSNYSNTVKLNNYRLDIGAAAGIGIELMKFLVFEFRFEHNFTGPYNFAFGDETGSRLLDSFFFLSGVYLSKLKL